MITIRQHVIHTRHMPPSLSQYNCWPRWKDIIYPNLLLSLRKSMPTVQSITSLGIPFDFRFFLLIYYVEPCQKLFQNQHKLHQYVRFLNKYLFLYECSKIIFNGIAILAKFILYLLFLCFSHTSSTLLLSFTVIISCDTVTLNLFSVLQHHCIFHN